MYPSKVLLKMIGEDVWPYCTLSGQTLVEILYTGTYRILIGS